MTPYSLSLLALLTAFIGQSLAAGVLVEALRQTFARGLLLRAIAYLLLALHHGYSLELALRTGLYDLRQALLAGVAALLLAGVELSVKGSVKGRDR